MLKFIFIGIAICCYLIALTTPAFKDISTGKRDVDGYVCFFFGILGFIHNIWMTVAWLANIPFFIALFYLVAKKSTEMAIMCSTFALFLSFATVWVNSTLINEGGDTVDVKMGLGAYCWIAAIVALLVGSILHWIFPTL
jgi:uncharacterized membrane-anchored protein YitT (DUF2179 family)